LVTLDLKLYGRSPQDIEDVIEMFKLDTVDLNIPTEGPCQGYTNLRIK